MADIAIYYSYENFFDNQENHLRTDVEEYTCWPRRRFGHFSNHHGSHHSCKILMWHQLPFVVITKKNLKDLSKYQMVILSNAPMLDTEEMEAFRSYVRDGGALYTSRLTSLLTPSGRRLEDFALADLMGVSYAGETQWTQTYVRPEEKYLDLFDPFTPQWPATLTGDAQTLVTAAPGAEIIARITLPWTDPQDSRYAALLTNPPGKPLDNPALVLNRYGKGQVMYSSGVIERWAHPRLWNVLAGLWKKLLKKPPAFETDAHPSVEILLYDQPARSRYVVNVLNVQQELPNIPVFNMSITVRLDGRTATAVSLLPAGTELPFTATTGGVQFTLPKLEYFAMAAVTYRKD